MAISIKLQPQELTPVYNEVILVLDSTKKTEPLFNYVVDINIGGVYSSQMKVETNPDGYGVLDMHKHLESSVSFNIDHTSTTITKRALDSFIEYDVVLKEQYLFTVDYFTVTNVGGFTRFFYGTPHYLEVGDYVTQSASGGGAYDGDYLVTAVNDPTTITTNQTFVGATTGTTTRADGAATIISGGTVMTGTTYAFNGVLPWLDVPNWDFNNYVPGNGGQELFLTTIPAVSSVRVEDRIWLNFYNSITNNATYLKVVSNQGTFRILNPYPTTSTSNKLLSVGVGPWNINNTTSTVITDSGALPIIGSGTTSYTVQLTTAGFPSPSTPSYTASTETLTFNVDRRCSKFENYKLMYLDRFGSFLTVNFDLAHKKSVKVNKSDYKANYGTYNSTTNTWGYNSWDRGKSRLDTDISDTYTIKSNWVNEDTGGQIIELMESPEVYHLKADGTLLAINITTSSLEEKQQLNEKIFNYELGFEYSFKNTVQRG